MKYLALILAVVIAVSVGLAALWKHHEKSLSHDDSFSNDALFTADVSKPTDTQMVAHADVPLDPTKNVLWCGTMQLAWNKAIDLVGEKLQFEKQPPVVDLLNRKDFTDADLDSGSYVAIADFERNNVEDEIRAALEKTFQGAASPELIPGKPSDAGPSDFVAYAYLYKNLAFECKFKIVHPMVFSGQRVEAFGFTWGDKNQSMISQVGVYDYQSENDFIVSLQTKSEDDFLILAKITPQATLEGTMTQVLQRMKKSYPKISYSGQLAVPRFNFKLNCDFADLENLTLQPSVGAHIQAALVIKEAKQSVRFQLNEKGAILKSEAYITATLGGGPPPPRAMVFDKPFLIMMKRANSSRPYFALWVGNASLLVPAKSIF